jgi:hypothetical protein
LKSSALRRGIRKRASNIAGLYQALLPLPHRDHAAGYAARASCGGAGLVGVTATARRLARSLNPPVLEAGTEAGHAVPAWGQVRMYSPWRCNTDAAARAQVAAEGWVEPAP